MEFLKKGFFSAILFFFFLSTPLYPQTAELYYKKGVALLNKDPHGAFESLRKVLDLSKKSKEWDQYVQTMNLLASLENDLTTDETEIIFLDLKEAVTLQKNFRQDTSVAQLHFYVASFYDERTLETDLPVAHFQKAIKIWTSLKKRMEPPRCCLLPWTWGYL